MSNIKHVVLLMFILYLANIPGDYTTLHTALLLVAFGSVVLFALPSTLLLGIPAWRIMKHINST